MGWLVQRPKTLFPIDGGKIQMKNYVYLLEHQHANDIKALGFFPSYKKALETIPYYQAITGFCDFPDNFSIKKFRVHGMSQHRVTDIFCLTHEYEDEYHYQDISTYLGVYSTPKIAEQALAQYRRIKRFKRYPNGFCIDKWTLNQKEWCEGFTYG